MNTPRSGLIRATEGAIKEYIKDGCAENLPMIRQLEDVAYQIWVESNTSFLNETIDTLEDEDDLIWDEDYLFQSFTAHADDNLNDAVEDANSSICSSIKPCDESDCSFGYLASCEDNDILELSGIESWELSDSDISDVHVAIVVDSRLPDNEQGDPHDEAESLNSSSVKLSNWNITHSLTTSSNKPVNVNGQNDTTPEIVGDKSLVCDDTELNDTYEDDWVVVNYDISEHDPSAEWFIVSVNETVESKLETLRMKESAPIDICSNNFENNTRKFTDKKSDKDGVVDLNEWAVLSMNITERKKVSKELGIKKENMTDITCGIHSHDVKTAYKHNAPLRLIQDTLGIKGQSSCEKSNINKCPLCSKRKDEYKCAIFCLLLE